MPEIEVKDDTNDILMYSDLAKIFSYDEIKKALKLKSSECVNCLPEQNIDNDRQSILYISRGQVLEYVDIVDNDNDKELLDQIMKNEDQSMKGHSLDKS